MLRTACTQRGFDWNRAFKIKQINFKREAIKMRLPQASFQGNIKEYFTEERIVKLSEDSKL